MNALNPFSDPCVRTHSAPCQAGLCFRQVGSGMIADSIWDELRRPGLWSQSDFAAHEWNTLKGAGDRTEWRPFFADWFPMEEGQTWCSTTERVIDPVYIPRPAQKASLNDFLDSAQNFFERFAGKKIGVQLSGGFDSSLVIGLLRHFGIPHGLVGMESDRYEFRTERTIQHRLAEQNSDVLLIDEATCLPYSRLREVPPHQVPDLLSLNHAQDRDMALACQQLGIEVLLSGGGGDNLLGQAVPEDPEASQWRPQTFSDPFPRAVVYRNLGIDFLSFFEDLEIVNTLFSLRQGQGEDCRKQWARQFFRQFVPRELVDYTYCADFWGRSIDGLVVNLSNLRDLHQQALEISGNAYFHADNLQHLLAKDIYRPHKELYQRIESRLSSAIWVLSMAQWLAAPVSKEKAASSSHNHPLTSR